MFYIWYPFFKENRLYNILRLPEHHLICFWKKNFVDKVAGELSEALTSAFSAQDEENYDFNVMKM